MKFSHPKKRGGKKKRERERGRRRFAFHEGKGISSSHGR